MSICVICDKEIPEARLKILPKTNICGRKCGEEIDQKHEILQKEIDRAYAASFQDLWHKQDNVSYQFGLDKLKNKELIYKLVEKKNTCIVAHFKYKENKISKISYITEFKKFTWWIKETLEKYGGKLIDTPLKYTTCQKCGNLSVVIWSPKFNNYFIGCTQYYKGCKWLKSIWIMPNS